MKLTISTLACFFAAFLIGCSDSNSAVSPPQSTPPSSQASRTDQPGATAAIGLELLSITDLPAQLAARKGKVVVLDMWATW